MHQYEHTCSNEPIEQKVPPSRIVTLTMVFKLGMEAKTQAPAQWTGTGRKERTGVKFVDSRRTNPTK
jgi:hypothetical protein